MRPGMKLTGREKVGVPQAIEDSRSMRNVALMDKIPYFTTAAAGHAAAQAMASRDEGPLEVRSLQGA